MRERMALSHPLDLVQIPVRCDGVRLAEGRVATLKSNRRRQPDRQRRHLVATVV
jgi:hypothetical protein